MCGVKLLMFLSVAGCWWVRCDEPWWSCTNLLTTSLDSLYRPVCLSTDLLIFIL